MIVAVGKIDKKKEEEDVLEALHHSIVISWNYVFISLSVFECSSLASESIRCGKCHRRTSNQYFFTLRKATKKCKRTN